MRFSGIRLVEQLNQNFVALESVFKKRVTVLVGLFCFIKTATKIYQITKLQKKVSHLNDA